MEKLTKGQEKILTVIKKFVAEHQYSPTVREIAKGAELSSPSTIHTHLTKLIEKGYLKKGLNKNRTIELLVENEYLKGDKEELIKVPLIDTVSNLDDEIKTTPRRLSISSNMIINKRLVYALLIKNDYLKEENIFKEDILILERTNNITEANKVLTINNGKLVIKDFSEGIEHIGKIVGLFRKF